MQEPVTAPSRVPSEAPSEGFGNFLRSFSRGWRIVRTAISFAAVGFLAPLLALVVMPLLGSEPSGR